MILEAQLIDLHLRQIYPVALEVAAQKIKKITPIDPKPGLPYLLPGYIDAHVHVESSMLVPSEFARLAVVHGTVATISDPHEIANVCGMQGVEYMIENGKTVPFKFNFGAPSCVPATVFETAGDALDAEAQDLELKTALVTAVYAVAKVV
jgi:adenine deaminase